MGGTLYVFLRHAESVANVGGWLSGWEDVALTETGVAQARAAAATLADLPLGRILVSDLGRARHTAALVLTQVIARRGPLPVHVLGDLRERRMGIFQGVNIASARADGTMSRYMLPWGAHPPGGESHAEVAARAIATLRAWEDGTPTLVVAHGSLLRNVVGLLDEVPVEEIGRSRAAVHAEPMIRIVTRWPAVPPGEDTPHGG